MTASSVNVLASQKWADHIARLLADNHIDVPVVALGTTTRRASRCETCGQPLRERAA